MEEIALQSEEPTVTERSIGLYVNCFLAMCDDDDMKRHDDDMKKLEKKRLA